MSLGILGLPWRFLSRSSLCPPLSAGTLPAVSARILSPAPLVLPVQITTSRSLHVSCCRLDLMEFFDEKKNWGAQEVRTGRSWTLDELRLKSSVDLHKLWYVLYKEKNMLLTMEEECERQVELFPNPERLDRVEESMERLETVVSERNKAVKLLEVGVTGEPPIRAYYTAFGRRNIHKRYEEHLMPWWRNARFHPRRYVQEPPVGMPRTFLLAMSEKIRRERRKRRNYQLFRLHQARDEYPEHPIWKQKELDELTLEEVYHSKMSD